MFRLFCFALFLVTTTSAFAIEWPEKFTKGPPPDLSNATCDIVRVDTQNRVVFGPGEHKAMESRSERFPRAGTGTVIGECDNYWYIATAGHVVTGGGTHLQFSFPGERSEIIPVTWLRVYYRKNTSHDFALGKIRKDKVTTLHQPRVLYIADHRFVPKKGMRIATTRFGSFAPGEVVEYGIFRLRIRSMAMLKGMSGSPVVDYDHGNYVHGLLLTDQGHCVTAIQIHSFLTELFTDEDHSQFFTNKAEWFK